MAIEIEIHDRALQEGLSRLRRRLDDLSPVLADTAEHLLTVTEEAFEAQRSPGGKAWPDLAPATWRHKRTSRMLYESGTLQGSLTPESDHHEARLGVNAASHGFPYGIVHQFGSRHVPARPFLPVDESGAMEASVVEEILELFRDYLDH